MVSDRLVMPLCAVYFPCKRWQYQKSRKSLRRRRMSPRPNAEIERLLDTTDNLERISVGI